MKKKLLKILKAIGLSILFLSPLGGVVLALILGQGLCTLTLLGYLPLFFILIMSGAKK